MGIRWLHRFFAKRIRSKDFTKTKSELVSVLEDVFSDIKFAAMVYNQLVVYTIRNNFEVNSADIMLLFREYNFTAETYALLMYKIGMLSKEFIDNPDIVIDQAKKMTEMFSPNEIANMEAYLDNYYEHKDEETIRIYHEIMAEREEREYSEDEDEFESEDDKANNAIDNWIKNKNKRK